MDLLTPPELHQEIVKIWGEYEIIQNYRRGSKRTGVWEIRPKIKDSETFIVKSYNRKTRWHPEVFAYKNWIPAIHPYAPELIKTLQGENYQAIIITSLKGITLKQASHLPEKKVKEAYKKAGELTKKLHRSFKGSYFGRPDCRGNPIEIFYHTDPVCYMQQSILGPIEQGEKLDCFDRKEENLAEWALERAEIFKDSTPRAVSWDSSPNNWIVDPENGEFLGMIDFENMVWGFDVDNFYMVMERYFPDFPQGKEAFFRGYGREILEEKALQIRVACVKAGLNGVVYGVLQEDKRTENLAREMLASIAKKDQ